jgi:hypothetical protein
MRLLALIAFVLPATALAQPSGDLPPAPPPPPEPAQPQPPQPVYGPQPAYTAQPPYGAQPSYQAPPPVTPWAFHRGVTFEANLGVGFVRLTDSGGGTPINTDGALAGADLGVGGWLSPQLALTVRIAGNQVKYMGVPGPGEGNLVNAFFGPSLQFWANPNVWLGGGVGFATFRDVGGSCSGNGSSQCGVNGWGLDLRAGYSFGDTANTFNVSVELNPSFYSNNGSSGTATGFALLAGYQYL